MPEHTHTFFSCIKHRKSLAGFTLVEVVIALALLLVLAIAALPIYSNFQASTQLSQHTHRIGQTLRTARSYAMARYQASAYGVYFNDAAHTYTLFQGDSYAARNSVFDREYTVDPVVSLVTTFAGNEIVFSKGLGQPAAAGTITVTGSSGESNLITVNSLGLLSQ